MTLSKFRSNSVRLPAICTTALLKSRTWLFQVVAARFYLSWKRRIVQCNSSAAIGNRYSRSETLPAKQVSHSSWLGLMLKALVANVSIRMIEVTERRYRSRVIPRSCRLVRILQEPMPKFVRVVRIGCFCWARFVHCNTYQSQQFFTTVHLVHIILIHIPYLIPTLCIPSTFSQSMTCCLRND